MERRWAVDLEGSGKSPPEIVELAIVEMDGLELTGFRKHWLFRPRNGISPIVSRIHGIWDETVADAPELEDVADDILEWLVDAPIVGHNVRIEIDMLKPVLADWQPVQAFDTLRLARRLLPGQPKHGLETLGEALGLAEQAREIVGMSAHSAPYDAVLTALLFRHLVEPLEGDVRKQALDDADILRVSQASLL